MDKILVAGLQEQLNNEMAAALWYKQMRALLRKRWHGAHKYFHKQERGEFKHAHDFDKFLEDRGVDPEYKDIPEPNTPDGNNMLQAFQGALAAENTNLEQITTLYYVAENAEDPATCFFLQEFLDDDIEDIAEITEWILYLTRAGDDQAALIALDHKMYKKYG